MNVTPDVYPRFVTLLQRPDPKDLPPRRHRWTQIGRYDRRTTVGLPLLCRWYQNRILMREGEISRW